MHLGEWLFPPGFRSVVQSGQATNVALRQRIADPGDTFDAFGRSLKVTRVVRHTLRYVRDRGFRSAGFGSSLTFERWWKGNAAFGSFDPQERVYVHHWNR